MDVRCERCKTEYEFDDDRITEAGVTVKCTTCGHVFKVKRKALVVTVPVKPEDLAAAQPAPAANLAGPPEKPREWRVRQSSGNVFTFKELTTLQKWIVERKVTRDDEISLSGDSWKRLGNIAELASFFMVVDEAQKAAQLEALQAVTNSGLSQVPALPSVPAPPPGTDLTGSGSFQRTQPVIVPGWPGSLPEDFESAAQLPLPPWMPPPAPREAQAAAPAPVSTPARPPLVSRAEPLATPVAPVASPEPRFTASAQAPSSRPQRIERAPKRKSRTAPLMTLLVLAAVLGATVFAYVRGFIPAELLSQIGLPTWAEVAGGGMSSRAVPTPTPLPPTVAKPAPPSAPVVAPAPTPPQGALAAPTPTAQADAGAMGAATPDGGAAIALADTDAGVAPQAAAEPADAGPATPGASAKVVPAATAHHPAAPSFDQLMERADHLRVHEKAAASLETYAQAAEREPSRCEPYAGRGLALLDLGRPREAVPEFQQALRLNPRYAVAVMGMAETLKTLGRKAEAVGYYQKYLDILPDGPDAHVAKTAIEQLKE